MAAVNAQIEPGDTVAIWGCGPVGWFAIRSALMLGAGRVIAIEESSRKTCHHRRALQFVFTGKLPRADRHHLGLR